MPIFMMFGKYSSNALEGIRPERTAKAVALIKKHGGDIKSMYAVLGEHDLVLTIDFPNADQALAASVALYKLTGIHFVTSPVVEVEKFDKWGERDLAYPINDLTKGVYYIAEYTAGPKAVSEIENNFRYLKAEILRFLTVVVKPKKEKIKKTSPGKKAQSSDVETGNNEFSSHVIEDQQGGAE